MSRGLGALQTVIREQLRKLRNRPTTENALLWRVAEELHAVVISDQLTPEIPSGEVPNSFYKSYRRALLRLYDGGIVIVTEQRKLLSSDEVCAFYPDRTRRIEIRILRQCLLKAVLQFGARRPARATSSKREEQLLAELDSSAQAECARQWAQIRNDVCAAHVHAKSQEARDVTLRLYVKCTCYFDQRSSLCLAPKGSITHVVHSDTSSLAELLNIVEPYVPPNLQTKLLTIYGKAISRDRLEQSALKDILFRVGHFDRGGYHRGPRLIDTVKEHLLEQFPEILTTLPRYRAAPRRRGLWGTLDSGTPSHDPILDQIIDRHVFDRIRFLRAV